jgi:hypothetical protein
MSSGTGFTSSALGSNPSANGNSGVDLPFFRMPGGAGGSPGLRGKPKRNMARIVVYKLYTTAAATSTAAVSITIPQRGLITGVRWAGAAIAGAGATNHLTVELSASSANQIATNDTRESISAVALATNVASSSVQVNDTQSFPGIAIEGGAKLYIHATLVNNWSSTALNCYVTIAH